MEPSLTTLYELAKLFNVSTDYLVGLDGATINLRKLIEDGTWLKYFIDNPHNPKVQQFKRECENFELNYGNDIEFKKLDKKEKIVFFAKNAQYDANRNLPERTELNYSECIAAHELKNEIVIEKNFFRLLYELMPERDRKELKNNEFPCPNYLETRNKILNYYEELQPYRGLLNHFE